MKALNYSALLHPDILAMKHGGHKIEFTSILETNNAPTDLNLVEGLAATLVDRIVEYKIKEASRNGATAVEQ
jgi:hypothetical protein